jgi:DNA (cytosine-5)-methyltransferase 1
MHKFPYEWNLSETTFTKDKFTVFSCFACCGGSTMGYKLAGGNVLGCVEIDPRMNEIYNLNHNPKYSFIQDIREFVKRDDIPEELYNLDILDGSPPCSSFSMNGNRDKDWGKEKVFSEGQAKQVLDTLFFDFIDLAKKLQPKIVVAENVKGLILGKAMKYVDRIYKEFDEAGYYCQHFLLDGSKMGLPQKRERVFFICVRKDLGEQFLEYKGLELLPRIQMEFNEPIIPFKDISEDDVFPDKELPPSIRDIYPSVEPGSGFDKSELSNGNFFSYKKLHPDKPCNTLTSGKSCYHHFIPRTMTDKEFILASSFPLDFNFGKVKPDYACGMSVPPVMMANVATNVYEQLLLKMK